MRKSQSCPSFGPRKSLSSAPPAALPPYVVPSPPPSSPVPATAHHARIDYFQVHSRLTAMFKAPDHHVDVCVANATGNDQEALLEGEVTETTKNLAACLVTPCEPAEEDTEIRSAAMQRNMYYLTNPDRVGAYIARIRKKRRQSNPT